ncbi:DUF6898 family protein [Elioraea rosea]|uniref:DUF6898 family protein n=1 Tax=Elioraea rosea TaxID=2492390 RepID=UPI00118209CF|nr:hypothetical protein [Elioraea rosea]
MAYVGARHHGGHEWSLPTAELLLEERRMGVWLRVAAVDPATGEEVVAVGPAANPSAVRQAAIGKLRRRLAKAQGLGSGCE